MKERGVIGWVILVIFLAGVLIASCFAAVNNDDDQTLGRVRLVSHDYRDDQDCYRYGDCRKGGGNRGRQRDDNRRGGISPGPFDRSPVDFRDNRVTICFPFARCDSRQPGDEEQPPPDGGQPPLMTASLFPPTPTGIRDFVVNTTKAGLALGQAFATLTITFVSNLLVGIA